MKVCQLLFPVTPSGLLERLLNHRVINILTSNSGHNKNYMHEQAVQLLDFLVTVCVFGPIGMMDRARRMMLNVVYLF